MKENEKQNEDIDKIITAIRVQGLCYTEIFQYIGHTGMK